MTLEKQYVPRKTIIPSRFAACLFFMQKKKRREGEKKRVGNLPLSFHSFIPLSFLVFPTVRSFYFFPFSFLLSFLSFTQTVFMIQVDSRTCKGSLSILVPYYVLVNLKERAYSRPSLSSDSDSNVASTFTTRRRKKEWRQRLRWRG